MYRASRAITRLHILQKGNTLTSTQYLGPKSRTTFTSTRASYAAGLNVHREVEHNTSSTPFEFTKENYEKIESILKKYPKNYKASAVIALLDLAQRQNQGWLPLAAMNKVARILEMAPIRVYEVATFYTMFNREKIGLNNIQVCCTTPCMLRGGYNILDTVKKHLNINVGQSTKDGLFHLMEVECLGACVNAPMLQINDHMYEDLTPESTIKILDSIRNGEKPKIGPQINRNGCEGPHGRTTLLEQASGPYCRDLKVAMNKFKKDEEMKTNAKKSGAKK